MSSNLFELERVEPEKTRKIIKKLKEKIKLLKRDLNMLYLVDIDLSTGRKYYALYKRYKKEAWNKVSMYFEYIDTSHHSDNFDAMYGSNFKGYLTNEPDKVKQILKENLDIASIIKKLNKLNKELETIEWKEKNDKEYQRKIFEDFLQELITKYPNLKEKIKKLENKMSVEQIIDTLLTKTKLKNTAVYKPEELLKVTSSLYAGGYIYMYKDMEENTIILPMKEYIVMVKKPKYSPEWWNTLLHDKINGWFALFGQSTITIYKKEENFLELLSDLGFKDKNYYESSKWFIVTKSGKYKEDICNIVALSDDYNYLETKEEVLEKYKREKRWTWENNEYPKVDNIKYIDKFATME